jgi:hypothetical protein
VHERHGAQRSPLTRGAGESGAGFGQEGHFGFQWLYLTEFPGGNTRVEFSEIEVSYVDTVRYRYPQWMPVLYRGIAWRDVDCCLAPSRPQVAKELALGIGTVYRAHHEPSKNLSYADLSTIPGQAHRQRIILDDLYAFQN